MFLPEFDSFVVIGMRADSRKKSEASSLPNDGEGLRVFQTNPSVSFAAQSGQSARRVCREEKCFSVQQITAVLQQARGGCRSATSPPGRGFRADVLPLEEGIRGDVAE